MAETSGSTTVSTKLGRIAKLAREMPQAALTTLAQHIDIDWLREAHRRTRKDGATGVDRQTAYEYAKNLEENLRSLLERAKSGSYVASPVRRVHIAKAGDGSQTRPIGIPTFEDKVLQRAVTMVLEGVYEQSFLDCSYGFRPGRSAHQALRVVQGQTVKMAGKWVLELDIRKFFETLDHCHLRNIVRKRVRDGVLLRLIDKWLKAGVMEDGAIKYPEAGTPQGGVVSPILANIYLHEVLDEWFMRQVAPRLVGRAVLIRYADDAVIIFEQEEDAQRAGARAVGRTQAKAAGALWVFRYHWKLPGRLQFLVPCHRRVANVVKPPLATGIDILGGNEAAARAVSAAAAAHPFLPRHVAKP